MYKCIFNQNRGNSVKFSFLIGDFSSFWGAVVIAISVTCSLCFRKFLLNSLAYGVLRLVSLHKWCCEPRLVFMLQDVGKSHVRGYLDRAGKTSLRWLLRIRLRERHLTCGPVPHSSVAAKIGVTPRIIGGEQASLLRSLCWIAYVGILPWAYRVIGCPGMRWLILSWCWLQWVLPQGYLQFFVLAGRLGFQQVLQTLVCWLDRLRARLHSSANTVIVDRCLKHARSDALALACVHSYVRCRGETLHKWALLRRIHHANRWAEGRW